MYFARFIPHSINILDFRHIDDKGPLSLFRFEKLRALELQELLS